MRLKFLLVFGKVGCSSEMTLVIRDDVIYAIPRCMGIEKDEVQIQMDTESNPKKDGYRTLPVLHANIPTRSILNEGLY